MNGKTIETGTGTKSPSNPYTLTDTTKVTANWADYTLPVPGRSVPNGVHDAGDMVSGLFTQNVWELLLNGTETYGTGLAGAYRYFALTLSKTAYTVAGSSANLKCSHFTAMYAAGLGNIYIANNGLTLYIYPTDTTITTAALFKSWLSDQYAAGTPLVVIYQLSSSVTTQYSPQQIRVYYPYTEIHTNTDSALTATYPTWLDLIYDRTQSDIDDKTAKGYYNYTDLNRIEYACQFIAYIFNISITTRSWTRMDFPTTTEMTRIKSNIATLRNAYFTYITTPSTPDTPFNEYLKANDIEKILNDIKALYDTNALDVLYCDEIYSGEMIGVI